MAGLRIWLVVTAAVAGGCMPLDASDLATASAFALDDGGLGEDGDVDAPDAFDGGLGDDGDIDAPDDGGFDGGGEAGMDAPSDGGFDGGGGGSDGGLDAGGGFDGGGGGSDGGFDAGGGLDGGGSGSDGGMPDGGMSDGGVPDAGPPVVAVDVVPEAVDFGEVRVGSPEPSAAITITNRPSSTAPAQLTSVALRTSTPALVLSPPATPLALAPGASVQATLTLQTVADGDLAGQHVDIVIDGSTRAVPVLGRVVTPSSVLTPLELDLGSACVGTQVVGAMTLTNDGTATLTVDAPVVDPSDTFVVTSAGTPGPLAPGASFTAEVSPVSSATTGPLSAMLLWHDDVPTDHAASVTVEYVSSGTAVSPKGLDFGTVPVDAPFVTGLVNFQNCDPTPSTFEIQALRTKQGTLAAWRLSPPVGTRRQLSFHENQQITVTFDPTGRGRYQAELTVRTSDGPKVIQLLGDSTGRDFPSTSFYTCTCTGGGPAADSWPILLAVAVAFRSRRRRRASTQA